MPLWLADRPLVLASKSADSTCDPAGRRTSGRGRAQPTSTSVRSSRAVRRAIPVRSRRCWRARRRVPLPCSCPAGSCSAPTRRSRSVSGDFPSPPTARPRASSSSCCAAETHELHSAIALVREDTILFEHRDTARLTMRAFSDRFPRALSRCRRERAVTASVGGYQLEKIGIQLFERIEGDHFVILGLAAVAAAAASPAGGMARGMICRAVQLAHAMALSDESRFHFAQNSLVEADVHPRPDRLARHGKIDHGALLRRGRRAGARRRCRGASALRGRGRGGDRSGVSRHHRGRQGRSRQAGRARARRRTPRSSGSKPSCIRSCSEAEQRLLARGARRAARRSRCSTSRSCSRPAATRGSTRSWWCRRRRRCSARVCSSGRA